MMKYQIKGRAAQSEMVASFFEYDDADINIENEKEGECRNVFVFFYTKKQEDKKCILRTKSIRKRFIIFLNIFDRLSCESGKAFSTLAPIR